MIEPVPTWEIVAGRCGACTKFVKDFGGDDPVYGHCGRKPRAGSIDSATFRCDVYVPIAQVAPSAAPVSRSRSSTSVNPFDVTARSPRREVPTRSRGPRAPAKVVVRKPSREERDHEVVDLGDEDNMDRGTLRQLIQEAIEDSMGMTGEVEMLERFTGGTVEIRPGNTDTQSKEIPVDAFMNKIVMIRDNLRVLEQKINANRKLDPADKLQMQQYITRCYGSLTTFNSLFKHREDGFRGSGS
jgi:hypothetical protein